MSSSKTNTFHTLAKTAQQINETRGSNAKIKICADYFRSLETEDNLRLAAQFLGEGAFSDLSEKRASVGSRTYSTLAADICEIDYDKVFKPSKTALGSSSETIEKLFNNIPAAREKWSPQYLTLKEVNEIFEELQGVSSRADKQQILANAWAKMTPLEVKYFLRILGRGSLRIGFESKSIVSSIAKAFIKQVDNVRYVHMITGSIGKTAILARNDQLNSAQFNLFQPISFMLASPVESRTVDNYTDYLAEEKFDGMRCQIHIKADQVRIFSRDMNEITHSFPEIVTYFEERNLPGMVLDGEICVFRDDTIMPFQHLQKRMGLKKPSKKIRQQYPTILISYDILFHDGDPVFEQTLLERRELLKKLSNQHKFPITTQHSISHKEEVDQLFNRALAHGNEGLMLKHKHSTYEYGQRRKSWLKVKKPGGSIDTIMMYAHAGSGKRGGTYSDFTLGVSVRYDVRYEEEFIPIGKAYGGYTDDELKKLNEDWSDILSAT